MQRREGGCVLQLIQNRVVDKAMLEQLGATMDNAMSDSRRHGKMVVSKKFSDAGNGFFLPGNWRHF